MNAKELILKSTKTNAIMNNDNKETFKTFKELKKGDTIYCIKDSNTHNYSINSIDKLLIGMENPFVVMWVIDNTINHTYILYVENKDYNNYVLKNKNTSFPYDLIFSDINAFNEYVNDFKPSLYGENIPQEKHRKP